MNPILLSNWLPVCEKAGIEAVPAEVVLETTKAALAEAMDGESPLWDEINAVVKNAGGPWMYRWDCCSPGLLKAIMAHGCDGVPLVGSSHYIDDPRLWDIIEDFPEEEMRLYRRPWVKAVFESGYPVEFRVFVSGGCVSGVSSYYPQRPLPDEPYHLWACTAGQQAEVLIEHGAPPDCTMDFLLVAETKRIVFLEGGPPHREGYRGPNAHPCCFAPGKVSGIALCAQEGALRA